jgi:hypothetical protein
MTTKRNHAFFYKNGLSLVVLLLMFVFLAGQFITGWHEKNNDLGENGKALLTASEYVTSGHFLQSTFENWESEFLQMAIYVLLTISLRQRGSSESKKLDGKEEVDREPVVHRNSPWPVKRGGIWLKLYSNSLSLAFAFLFAISFVLHFYGSLIENNEENIAKNLPAESWTSYIAGSRFWFESFQNWQSEFLSVFAIIFLSIYLREFGSPQSKPVDAPHWETGE